MQVGLLGPLKVVGADGIEMRVPGAAKERAVLAVLGLRAGTTVAVWELIDALWGEDPPVSAAKTLQKYVSALRRRLPPGVIATAGAGYQLNANVDTVDVFMFEHLVEAGQRALAGGDAEASVGWFRQALGLWRGDPLVELADRPWGTAEKARLMEGRRNCQELLAEARLAAGEARSLVGELEAAAAAEPLRERRWTQLMLALYRAGRQADALRAYQRLRAQLADQLGIEPSAELRHLEESILLQTPELDWQAKPVSAEQPAVEEARTDAANEVSAAGTGAVSLAKGLVTFVFTDIEGSTSLWEHHPARMGAVLVRHNQLIRDIVRAEGGQVFKTVGDAVHAVFGGPVAAVRAALAVQAGIASADWSEIGGLAVRIGIYTGEAQLVEGEWQGRPLNRCARLRDAAGGAEILVSQATMELVGDDLAEQAVISDLGQQHLRGVSRTERAHLVQAGPGLTAPAAAPSGEGPNERPDSLPPSRQSEAAIGRCDVVSSEELRQPALTTEGVQAARPATRRTDSAGAAGRTPHSLPLALTRFVGRARERAELRDLLAGGTRLLTLTGVGGVGKTRLALESTSDVAGRYLGGVRLFEFAPVNDEGDVLSLLVAAFGIHPELGSDAHAVTGLLCEHLSTRQLLLLFDNCEHVIDVVARIVTAVARDCADVAILATSREPLRVQGEVVFAVPPLQLPDLAAASTDDVIDAEAVVLFCDRALDARPDLRSTPLDLPAVVRICRRLDGIPLALELAAARFRTLTLSEIADHLDQCLQLLVVGARTATRRQQTLRGALDWSYELLPRTEQAGLRQLSVLPGTFDLEAAGGVVAGDVVDFQSPAAPVAALELISQLVDKSLVVADMSSPAARYRLLEPVRQYAAEKLAAAGETTRSRRRHRDHFVARALRRDAHPAWINIGPAGLAEFDNYRAALEWSWDHGDIEASLVLIVPQTHARIDNHDLRVRQWLETILATPEPSTHPARAQALAMLALIVQESAQPDPERSRQLMADALAVARRLGDPIVTAYIQFQGAELHLAWGNSSQARAFLTAAIEAYRETAPPATTGWCYEHLGWAAIIEGDFQAARTHFDQAARLASADTDGAWLLPHALAALAPVTAAFGEPQQALVFADQALAAARRLAFPRGVIMALCRAAETALLAGSQRRAAELIVEMLGLVRDRADQAWLADGLEMAALVLDSRGDMSAAAAILNDADALRRAAGERPGGARPIATAVDEARRRLLQVPIRHDASDAFRSFSSADATDHARSLLDEQAGPPP